MVARYQARLPNEKAQNKRVACCQDLRELREERIQLTPKGCRGFIINIPVSSDKKRIIILKHAVTVSLEALKSSCRQHGHCI